MIPARFNSLVKDYELFKLTSNDYYKYNPKINDGTLISNVIINKETGEIEDMKETITCVYCGHKYPDNTPSHGAAILTEHIKICEKHPIRAAEEKIEKLWGALSDLVGVKTIEELQGMKAAMLILKAPAQNREVAIKAIDVLIETK